MKYGEYDNVIYEVYNEPLRVSWATVDRIDPTQPTYKKLDKMLEKMSVEDLEKIVDAKIKFVSSLALAKSIRKSRGQ